MIKPLSSALKCKFVKVLLSYLLFGVYVWAYPATSTPSCNSPYQGIEMSTYNKSGYNHPNNHTQYNTLVSNYAIPAKLFGSSVRQNINGFGNPYGNNDNYLSIFKGYINAPVTGTYGIGIDGDDAVEVIIDGTVVTGWYGGHGRVGHSTHEQYISMNSGYHTIEFRQEEVFGGDNYFLYWKKPGDTSFSIVPPSAYYYCAPHLEPVVPVCNTPLQQLEMSTFNKTGYGHPNNYYQFQELISNYGVESKLYGSGYTNQVNGSGNPYGGNDDYLTIFKGYIYAPVAGRYEFGIDGDDAVEYYIDNTLITGWYGGHGRTGSATHIVQVDVDAGWHTIEFHHEEAWGGDNYYLYWKRPGGSTEIVPSGYLYHCNPVISKNSCIISDPVNNTTYPKRIPGGTIRYAISVENTRFVAIDDVTVADDIDSNFNTDSIKNLQIQSGDCNCTGVSSASNNGSNGTSNGVNPVILDFGTVAGNSKECGYFEVDIK